MMCHIDVSDVPGQQKHFRTETQPTLHMQIEFNTKSNPHTKFKSLAGRGWKNDLAIHCEMFRATEVFPGVSVQKEH